MKQMETDVVVVSAGTAGLPAAVTAAEGGARVIVFEKKARTGGALPGGQIIAAGSNAQHRQGISITSRELFNIHMDFTHWLADARLVKAFYDESGPTINWFEKLGIPFSVMEHPTGHYPVTHSAPENVRPKVLTEKAGEFGARILLKTPVKKLIREGDRVTGVIAEDIETGEQVQARAKAVIVAAGGFGDNPEMIKEYTGFEWGKDIFSFRIKGSTGDGIRMAWEVGAARSTMLMQLIFGMPGHVGPTGTSMDTQEFAQPNLLVNLSGERFTPEEMLEDTSFAGNIISKQRNRCAFMIFDGDTKKHYQANGLDRSLGPGRNRRPSSESAKTLGNAAQTQQANFDFEVPGNLKADGAEDLDAAIQKALDRGYQHLFMEDSLEALCARTGIDLNGLQKTIVEYNDCCDRGYDTVFQKDSKYLRPVRTPKFYATRFYPSAYGSLGGIKINYKTEVLNNDDRVIPGLYAAGIDAGSIYSDTYTRFLYGNTMGFCVTTGRIAGKRALEYLKSSK
jgi:fumarate reductase flavoprotein subunit